MTFPTVAIFDSATKRTRERERERDNARQKLSHGRSISPVWSHCRAFLSHCRSFARFVALSWARKRQCNKTSEITTERPCDNTDEIATCSATKRAIGGRQCDKTGEIATVKFCRTVARFIVRFVALSLCRYVVRFEMSHCRGRHCEIATINANTTHYERNNL